MTEAIARHEQEPVDIHSGAEQAESPFRPSLRITDYLQIVGMPSITAQDLVTIEKHAQVLTLEQCYHSMLLDPGVLTPQENYYVELAHKKGIALSINEACTKLFTHMRTKNGGNSCLEYLKHKQAEFATVEVNSSNKGFAFNVTMHDEQ